jgi:hypothetical protein
LLRNNTARNVREDKVSCRDHPWKQIYIYYDPLGIKANNKMRPTSRPETETESDPALTFLLLELCQDGLVIVIFFSLRRTKTKQSVIR